MIQTRFEPISGKCGEILEFMMSSEPVLSLEDDLQFKIRLCAEEVVENITSYAYQTADGFLELEMGIVDGCFTMTFKDGGVRFDPLAKPDPDVTLSVEDRPIGGLGIFLCKQMMDQISYKYENGKNVLSMGINVPA